MPATRTSSFPSESGREWPYEQIKLSKFTANSPSSLGSSASVLSDQPSPSCYSSDSMTEGSLVDAPSSLKPKQHIKRPPNAFFLYRSDFIRNKKLPKSVEHDHRQISSIVGHCWKNLPDSEKLIWYQKADAAKKEHERRFPHYKYEPQYRKTPSLRSYKRRTPTQEKKCQLVAELLMAGTEGEALAEAMKDVVVVESLPTNETLCSKSRSLVDVAKARSEDVLPGPMPASRTAPYFGVPSYPVPLLSPSFEDIYPIEQYLATSFIPPTSDIIQPHVHFSDVSQFNTSWPEQYTFTPSPSVTLASWAGIHFST